MEMQAEDISFHAPIGFLLEGAHCQWNVYKTRWNRCVSCHWIFSASPLLHGCAHHVQADFFWFPAGTAMVPPLRQALHLSSCPKVPDAVLRGPQDPTHMCVTQGIWALSPPGATSDQGKMSLQTNELFPPFFPLKAVLSYVSHNFSSGSRVSKRTHRNSQLPNTTLCCLSRPPALIYTPTPLASWIYISK